MLSDGVMMTRVHIFILLVILMLLTIALFMPHIDRPLDVEFEGQLEEEFERNLDVEFERNLDMDTPESTVPPGLDPVDWEQCMTKTRPDSVRATCRQYQDTLEQDYDPNTNHAYWRLMVNDKQRLLYCVIPKAGCSSWKAAMVLANTPGLTENDFHEEQVHLDSFMQQHGLRWANKLPLSEIKWRLQNYTKFAIFRDPLTRLFSAYVDKMTFDQNYIRGVYGTQLKQAFPNVTDCGNCSQKAFPELLPLGLFLKVIAGKGIEKHILSQLDEFRKDRHWHPQVTYCHPCFIHYDFIGKIETMEQDSHFLLPLFGADKLPSLNSNMEVTTKQKRAKHIKLLKQQFSKTPVKIMEALKKLYSIDYAVLGYDKEDVLC